MRTYLAIYLVLSAIAMVFFFFSKNKNQKGITIEGCIAFVAGIVLCIGIKNESVSGLYIYVIDGVRLSGSFVDSISGPFLIIAFGGSLPLLLAAAIYGIVKSTRELIARRKSGNKSISGFGILCCFLLLLLSFISLIALIVSLFSGDADYILTWVKSFLLFLVPGLVLLRWWIKSEKSK